MSEYPDNPSILKAWQRSRLKAQDLAVGVGMGPSVDTSDWLFRPFDDPRIQFQNHTHLIPDYSDCEDELGNSDEAPGAESRPQLDEDNIEVVY